MSLLALEIENVRIIHQSKLTFSTKLNVFTGPNASGKTSWLEAIHLLAVNRSFRTAHWQDCLRHETDYFRVHGTVYQIGREIHLGIQRSAQGLHMRADGEPVKKTSDMAIWLPAQVMHPESYLLVSGGPKMRRQFLDWGLFHVEPSFIQAWRRYERALKQRNHLLKYKNGTNRHWPETVKAWNPELEQAALVLHRLRMDYVQALNAITPIFVQSILGNAHLEIEYIPGWDLTKTLSEQLNAKLAQDAVRGFTTPGPHRSELRLRFNGYAAKHTLSRGQQKMLVIALMLAQMQLFSEKTAKDSLFLIDDIAAELDTAHRQRLLQLLWEMPVQLFISCTESRDLGLQTWTDKKIFQLHEGQVQEVL